MTNRKKTMIKEFTHKIHKLVLKPTRQTQLDKEIQDFDTFTKKGKIPIIVLKKNMS